MSNQVTNSTWANGICVEADCYDLTTRTYTREEMGVVVATRPMTTAEWLAYGPQPLDRIGAMAALNVVLGVWGIEDAANVAGVTPDALVAEAEGWAAAGGV